MDRFINDYMKLPIMKLETKQDIDIPIESITVLKHSLIIDEGLKLIMRVDGTIWTYKELTKHDPVEYEEGTDPKLDYMPDEYIAPISVKINGASYRASVLTWFPLTDCADAIEIKEYITGKQITYPVYIEKGKSPMRTIIHAVGVKIIDMLPPITNTCLKPIDINDEFENYCENHMSELSKNKPV